MSEQNNKIYCEQDKRLNPNETLRTTFSPDGEILDQKIISDEILIDVSPDTAGMFRYAIAILGSFTEAPLPERTIIKEMLLLGIQQTELIKTTNEKLENLFKNQELSVEMYEQFKRDDLIK